MCLIIFYRCWYVRTTCFTEETLRMRLSLRIMNSLHSETRLVWLLWYIITCMWGLLFKIIYLPTIFLLGDIWGPWGALSGTAVYAGAQKILIRFTLHSWTSLWLSGICQLEQNQSGCTGTGQGIHGAFPFQRRHPEHLTALQRLEQQSA